MSVPFNEWTREEKNEFAQRRMAEMKLLNEKYKQRHAEVEKDRIKAEEKHSSVTSAMNVSKEKSEASDYYKAEADMSAKPKVKEREWDRGKSNWDLEDWSSPKCHPRHAYFRGGPDKRHVKKTANEYREENWRDRPMHTNKDTSSRYRESGKSWSNRKFSEATNQGASNYRNDSSFSKQRGRSYNRERNNASYRSFHNSKLLNDSKKKTFVGADGSASQSPSDSEVEPIKESAKLENDRMWRDNGINDVRHRQIRVEKWVKSISNTCLEDVGFITPKPEESEYQDKSWAKLKVENPSYEKSKNIPDPEEILEDVVQEDYSYPYQYSWKDNPSQSTSTPFHEENTSRKNYRYNQSTTQRTSNKKWKSTSHSKNQSSSDYSGIYENQAFKKQSDRMSKCKKPDSCSLRKGKLKNESSSSGRFEDSNPSVDNCEWSSHELEFDDSVLVKIKSHTVKRTVYNSFGDTEKDNVQPKLPENELIDYETEMTSLNPNLVLENIQHNYMGNRVWDDCDYDDSIQNMKSVTKKQDSTILCQESSSQALFEETDHTDCDNYSMAKESEYANIKQNMEDLGPVENYTVIETNLEFNNEGSLNIELSDIKNYSNSLKKEREIYLDRDCHNDSVYSVLNTDDNNNDGGVECLNNIHVSPEVYDGTVENLEDVESLSNKNAPLEISFDSGTQAALPNTCNVMELHTDVCVVSKTIEMATTSKEEDNNATASKEEDNNATASKEEDNNATASKEEDNNATASKEEDNNATASKEEDMNVIVSKEEEMNVIASKEEDMNVIAFKEEDNNAATSNEEDGNVATPKEVVMNVTASKELDVTAFNELDVTASNELDVTASKELDVIAAKELDDVTASKEEDENSATSKEEDENVIAYKEEGKNAATSKKEKNSATSKEEDRNAVTSNEEEVNAATSNEEEVNAATSNEEEGNAATSNEEEGNAATSNEEEGNAATSNEEEGNSATSNEEEGNAATSNEEEGNAATSNEEERNAATSNEEEGNAATFKEEGNAATSNEEEGNAATSNEEERNAATSNEEERNAATSNEEERNAATSNKEDGNATISKEK